MLPIRYVHQLIWLTLTWISTCGTTDQHYRFHLIIASVLFATIDLHSRETNSLCIPIEYSDVLLANNRGLPRPCGRGISLSWTAPDITRWPWPCTVGMTSDGTVDQLHVPQTSKWIIIFITKNGSTVFPLERQLLPGVPLIISKLIVWCMVLLKYISCL